MIETQKVYILTDGSSYREVVGRSIFPAIDNTTIIHCMLSDNDTSILKPFSEDLATKEEGYVVPIFGINYSDDFIKRQGYDCGYVVKDVTKKKRKNKIIEIARDVDFEFSRRDFKLSISDALLSVFPKQGEVINPDKHFETMLDNETSLSISSEIVEKEQGFVRNIHINNWKNNLFENCIRDYASEFKGFSRDYSDSICKYREDISKVRGHLSDSLERIISPDFLIDSEVVKRPDFRIDRNGDA